MRTAMSAGVARRRACSISACAALAAAAGWADLGGLRNWMQVGGGCGVTGGACGMLRGFAIHIFRRSVRKYRSGAVPHANQLFVAGYRIRRNAHDSAKRG